MTRSVECEILIVGSGPGGAVTAASLAAAGHDVLLVEEGPDPRDHRLRAYSSEEMDQLYRNAALTPCLGRARVTYAEGRCLGGGSEINSGFYHRVPDQVLADWRERHGLNDLTPESLAPHFEAIEARLAITRVDQGEGPTSLKLKQGADSLGWDSQEVPRWITSNRDQSGNWSAERRGMVATYLADALAAGCRVMTGVRVERIETRDSRARSVRASRLEGYRSRGSVRIRFSRLFICAGAIGTPTLLRRSGFTRNVGSSLRLHPMTRVVARFDEEVNESGFGVPVRQVTEFKPALTLGCSVGGLPHLGLWLAGQARERLVERAAKLAIFYALITSETRGRVRPLPLLPEPLVLYGPSLADRSRLLEGLEKLCTLLFAAGAREIFLPFPGTPGLAPDEPLAERLAATGAGWPEANAIHLFASVPLGIDPRLAPLDAYGKLHGAENIWVNDTSMLPGCTGVNPLGTIAAVARRNVQRVIDDRR